MSHSATSAIRIQFFPWAVRTATLLLLLIVTTDHCLSAGAPEDRPLSESELKDFLGSSRTSLQWTKRIGPDFEVFKGDSVPPLTGEVGLYFGDWPAFGAGNFPTHFQGRLGSLDVVWFKKIEENGWIRQETVISLDGAFQKAHIWAEAKAQSDLDTLLAELSRLPRFSSGRRK